MIIVCVVWTFLQMYMLTTVVIQLWPTLDKYKFYLVFALQAEIMQLSIATTKTLIPTREMYLAAIYVAAAQALKSFSKWYKV